MSTFVVKVDAADIPDISIVEFISQVIDNIRSQIAALDSEINMASQGDTGQVKALSTSVSAIKTSAEQTSGVLSEILGDKGKLEVAIARLEGPGQTLLQLTKLVELVKSLEEELKGDPQEDFGYFSSVAELLTDVNKHMAKFEAYSSTPHLQSVRAKVDCIKDELERMVLWRVREIGPLLTTDDDEVAPAQNGGSRVNGAKETPSSSASSSSSSSSSSRRPHQQLQQQGSKSSQAAAANLDILAQVSDVVEVLGSAFRKDLLVRFAQLQLLPYDKLFCLGTRNCGVECLDRRYAWFRRIVSLADAKVGSIFPSRWALPVFLFVEFVRRTRNQLAEIMGSTPQPTYKFGSEQETMQIARLLAAVRSVVGFEKEMMSQFSASTSLSADELAAIVKQESISEAFDLFMEPWLNNESSRLDELLERLNKEETEGKSPAPLPGAGLEYNSSREMFAFIKASLGRCTEFSRGQTYVAASRQYRICLGKYVDKLRFRLPIADIPKPSGKGPQERVYVISNAVEYRLSRIVTTCVYCMNTVPKLEEVMRESVRPEFQSAVHFAEEMDGFESLLNATLDIINAGLVNRMDEAFKEMKRTDWTRVDSIGDDSPYVKMIKDSLAEAMPRLRKGIPPERFVLSCRKLAEAVLAAVKDAIYRLKRIAKIGAEQLKMDLLGLKDFLLKLPTVKQPAGTDPPLVNKAFNVAINSRFTAIQNILKLVSAEEDNVAEIYRVLCPEGTQHELDAIISLRCKQGGLMPSLPSAGVGKAAKDITSGMKSAFSEMLSGGGLFGSDDSSHHKASARSGGAAGVKGGSGSGVAKQGTGAAATNARPPVKQPAQQPQPQPQPQPQAQAQPQPQPKKQSTTTAATAPPQPPAAANAGVISAAASQRVVAFYERTDPSKVEHIRGLLTGKYKGKEVELLSKVQAQYPSHTI